MKVFVQDPETWLVTRGIEPSDYFDRDRPATIRASHRTRVNHELYYFADTAGLDRFRSDPRRYCGKVTDPVSGARFVPDLASPRIDHDGRPYFFISPETRDEFGRRPGLYAQPRREMPDAPEAADPWD